MRYAILSIFYVVSYITSTVWSADVYKQCHQIPFCKKFRHRTIQPKTQFEIVTSEMQNLHNNILQIPLTNQMGKRLKLQLSILKGDKVRVKVLEDEHARYEIQDVLVAEPETVSYEITQQNKDRIIVTSCEDESVKIALKIGTPFMLAFYKNGHRPDVLIDGSRLEIENTSESTAFHFDVTFFDAQALYGLHHHATKLVLPETADGSMEPFRLRNSDKGGYKPGDTTALYGAVPVVYGHSSKKTSGIFLHNAAQQWVDISYANRAKPSVHFMVEDGTMDLFIMLGPSPKDVVKQFTDLTGKPHMPQLWTLGYHQCRYSYMSQDDVKDVVTKMDLNRMPFDAIWLDIDYTDEKKYFTWNPENYSDPVAMQKFIASTKRKLVTIIDPHIKVDDDYSVYKNAKNKYFVKDANGDDFKGKCWPGVSSYIDYLNPEARRYWANLYSYEQFNGSTPTLAGTWNDMNEPSVFEAPEDENSMPGNAVHFGGVQHKAIHNMYGFLQTKATHEGLLERDNHKLRPFVLTRSHFAGSQRYAAIWTGDNQAEWSYLPISLSECLLSNVMGQVFCGADIGGFDGDPGEELLQRWYQAAVWFPFYRGHSSISSPRREPYLFKDTVKDNIRKSIETRYRYIPVFYTLFHQHVVTGEPISRPLFYEYPEMLAFDDHVLIGTDILATPVLYQNSTSVEVHFPGSNAIKWYRADLENDEWISYSGGSIVSIAADLTMSPIFYKAGSIITLWDYVKPSTADMRNEPLTIYVNLNAEGFAEGSLYGDDFESFEYTKGAFFDLRLTYSKSKLQIEQVAGNMTSTVKFERIIIHSLSSPDSEICTFDEVTTNFDGVSLIDLNIGDLLLASENNGLKKIEIVL